MPAYILLNLISNKNLDEFLELDKINLVSITYGLELGFVAGIIILLILQTPFFKSIPNNIEKTIKAMNLNWKDAVFLSLCAGIGEELLFRGGIQYYLNWPITSVLFVALHGYLNPWNLKFSMYGIVLLPFIFLISTGYYYFGIWFCIAAHFMYDLVIFCSILNSDERI